METLRRLMLLLREKRVHEKEAKCVLSHLQRKCSRDLETRVLASSSDRDLASIETLSETVALEVVGFTLRVDTIRGEPRTWFALV